MSASPTQTGPFDDILGTPAWFHDPYPAPTRIRETEPLGFEPHR